MKAENARFDYSSELKIENKKSVKEKKKVQYTEAELKEISSRHKHWLDEDCENWRGMRANFEKADLMDANLWDADLRGANLRGADLEGADLRDANLLHADLRDANLLHADLRGANLLHADLGGADLRGADLEGADLRDANLLHADLRGANLLHADLGGADLGDADLRGANLGVAKNVPFIPMACPDTGSFVGWKKARNGEIIKLLIPEDAKRSSATGRKCRCDRAVVLSIEKDGIIHDKPEPDFFACSNFNTDFVYRVGKTVSTNDFCDDRFRECAPGIHFFINRQEAVEYVF